MTNDVPKCEFCGDPAAPRKGSDPVTYRKYCGDICMGLGSSLKRVLSEYTDRRQIKELSVQIETAKRRILALIEEGLPDEQQYYPNGVPVGTKTVFNRAMRIVESQAVTIP